MSLDTKGKAPSDIPIADLEALDLIEAARAALRSAGMPPGYFWHLLNTGEQPTGSLHNEVYAGYRRKRPPSIWQAANLARGLVQLRDAGPGRAYSSRLAAPASLLRLDEAIDAAKSLEEALRAAHQDAADGKRKSPRRARRDLAGLAEAVAKADPVPSEEEVGQFCERLSEATEYMDSISPSALAAALAPALDNEWFQSERHRALLPLARVAEAKLGYFIGKRLPGLGAKILYAIATMKYHAVGPPSSAESFGNVRRALSSVDGGELRASSGHTADELQWLALHYAMTAGGGDDVVAEFVDRSERMAKLQQQYECDGRRCHACAHIHAGRQEEALSELLRLERSLDGEAGRSASSRAAMGFYLHLMKAEAYFRSSLSRNLTGKEQACAEAAVDLAFACYDRHDDLCKSRQIVTSDDYIAHVAIGTLYHLKFVFKADLPRRERRDAFTLAKWHRDRSDRGGCFRSRSQLDRFIELAERDV